MKLLLILFLKNCFFFPSLRASSNQPGSPLSEQFIHDERRKCEWKLFTYNDQTGGRDEMEWAMMGWW